MEIVKQAGAAAVGVVSAEDMELINALTRRRLQAEEVYTFAVRLCDNEVDREWERFPRETLEALAPLFVGKSGIFDHQWSARGQTARIYKTQVVEEAGGTRAGEGACCLKGWAYLLRTESNRDLIAEIDGGIKREVSVGCAVERELCSVCGEELGRCHHVKGRTYNGKLCWGELVGARDAYEWSFVAVPAQPGAGVVKALSPGLRELVKDSPRAADELSELTRAADLGRKYLEGLRREVVRLCALEAPGLDVAVVRSIAGRLDEGELTALRDLLKGRDQARRTTGPQLTYAASPKAPQDDGAFLV